MPYDIEFQLSQEEGIDVRTSFILFAPSLLVSVNFQPSAA